MINKLKRRKGLVVFGSIILLVAGSAAYAYWTTSGSGTGDAATGTIVPITVTQTSTPSGLYPGGTPAALAGEFNNGNAGPVHVHQVNATVGSVTGPDIANLPACTIADYAVGGFPVTVDDDIPTGSGQGAWTGGTVELTETGLNQDSCKGATAHLTYTSN